MSSNWGEDHFKIRTGGAGHMVIETVIDGKGRHVSLSRLQYIAYHGFDALQPGDRIEHKNGVNWDNRPENLKNSRFKPPKFKTSEKGYEYVYCAKDYEHDILTLHRLIYVAEYGLDSLDADEHVHHKNGVKWDNRPENLEARDASDHGRYHAEKYQARKRANAD